MKRNIFCFSTTLSGNRRLERVYFLHNPKAKQTTDQERDKITFIAKIRNEASAITKNRALSVYDEGKFDVYRDLKVKISEHVKSIKLNFLSALCGL